MFAYRFIRVCKACGCRLEGNRVALHKGSAGVSQLVEGFERCLS